jgi:hypothetical protein
MNTKRAAWKIYGAHKIIHLRPYWDWALIWKNVWKLEIPDSFYWEPPTLREKGVSIYGLMYIRFYYGPIREKKMLRNF